MQDTQSDLDSRRLGIDEQHINFRPSPNFKNMKKFLKYKKDLESSSQSPPNTSSDEMPPNNTPESPTNNNNIQLKEKRSPVQKPIQPPLPLDPPPPYTAPIIPIPLKQEIIDDEYPDSGRESPNLSTALSTTQIEPSQEVHYDKKTAEPDSTSTETCRDFLRGTCVRGETCRYAHKFDRTQLSNIYTFCKNFQNVRCTFPFCKYVHATVFEEQEFYRTGILLPHTINHTPIYLMPPPPPPPPPPETSPKPLNISATSLQAQTTYKQMISCASKIECKPEDGLKKIMTKVISLKREWSGSSLSTPPRDFENKENYAKKCKNCDNMDIRLQYNQEKIEDLKRSSLDLKTKASLLSKKTNALFSVLFTVLKSQASTAEGMYGLRATLNNCGEKEKALLQNILESHRGGSFSNMM